MVEARRVTAFSFLIGAEVEATGGGGGGGVIFFGGGGLFCRMPLVKRHRGKHKHGTHLDRRGHLLDRPKEGFLDPLAHMSHGMVGAVE